MVIDDSFTLQLEKDIFLLKICEKNYTQVRQVDVIPSDRQCVYLIHLLWPEVFQLLLYRSIYNHLPTENRGGGRTQAQWGTYLGQGKMELVRCTYFGQQ